MTRTRSQLNGVGTKLQEETGKFFKWIRDREGPLAETNTIEDEKEWVSAKITVEELIIPKFMTAITNKN